MPSATTNRCAPHAGVLNGPSQDGQERNDVSFQSLSAACLVPPCSHHHEPTESFVSGVCSERFTSIPCVHDDSFPSSRSCAAVPRPRVGGVFSSHLFSTGMEGTLSRDRKSEAEWSLIHSQTAEKRLTWTCLYITCVVARDVYSPSTPLFIPW